VLIRTNNTVHGSMQKHIYTSESGARIYGTTATMHSLNAFTSYAI
jgi:hypothetical protein